MENRVIKVNKLPLIDKISDNFNKNNYFEASKSSRNSNERISDSLGILYKSSSGFFTPKNNQTFTDDSNPYKVFSFKNHTNKNQELNREKSCENLHSLNSENLNRSKENCSVLLNLNKSNIKARNILSSGLNSSRKNIEKEEIFFKTSSSLKNLINSSKDKNFSPISQNKKFQKIDYDMKVERIKNIQNDSFNYEFEIKKLDYWDIKNEKKDQLDIISSENPKPVIIVSEKLLHESNLILNFLKKTDEEQNCLIWHNLNLTKKNFNFNLIKSQDAKSESDSKAEKNKMNSMKYNIKDKEPILIFLDLLNANIINPMTEFNFTNEYYRKVIKQKMLIELDMKRELIRLSKEIINNKLMKERLIKEKSEISRKLTNMRDDFDFKKVMIEKDKLKIDSFYSSIFESYSIPEDSSGWNSPRRESKKKSVVAINKNEKKKSIMTDETKFQIHHEYLKVTDLKKHESKKLTDEFNFKTQKMRKEIQKYETKVQNASNEVKNLTEKFKIKMEENKNYYLEILKKGIDVRTEGVTWCLRRLLEINMYLDYTSFPEFLDKSQIEYLIKFSTLKVENHNLSLIYKALRARPKLFLKKSNGNISENKIQSKLEGKILEMEIKEFRLDEDNSSILHSQNIEDLLNKIPQMYKNVFSAKTVKLLENVFIKFQHLIKIGTLERTLEDINIDSIISEMKNRLRLHGPNIKENEVISTPETPTSQKYSILKSKIDNCAQAKDQIEELILLRDVILNNEKELENLKKNQYSEFQKKIENLRTYDKKQSIYIDISRAALFGNGVSI
jgi:hypothetical protein